MTDARLAAAERALDAGDAATAAAKAQAIASDLRAPAGVRAAALRLRAEALARSGDLRGALDDAAASATLVPADARAWNALGIAAADAGEGERAIEAFAHATSLDPRYARAWANLGNALRSAGRTGDARTAFERAVAADPRYAFGWTHVAIARRDDGDDTGAADAARRALALDRRQRTARLVLAGLDRRAGRLDPAIDGYRQSLAEQPDDARSRFLLAGALAERDDLDDARAAYVQAARDDPRMLRARLGAELSLPMVAADAEAVARARERYGEGLARLRDDLPRRAAGMEPARALDELRWTNFLLAYQGENDLALQAAYGDLLEATLRAARVPAPFVASARGDRLRVAFVSAFFRDGTAGRYFESWITDLPRERFDVSVHFVGAGSDALTGRIRARADAFTEHGASLPSAIARAIEAGTPDVIVYPELGMDATTFALAALRLAPRQCAGWGHPVTSGLATIDDMFTAEAMEPADATSHYRERLVPLPGLGTRYARPPRPARADRGALGLPRDATLLLFPQSLFKLHPDNDALVAEVLAETGATLVAFEGRHPRLTRAWRARLDRALAARGVARERVVVVPQVAHERYLAIGAACDAMLDSVRWSGGNTSLDAIACALPVVTLPGATMRARQSAAMLRQVGVPELVAQDAAEYVALAARIAADPAWRDELSARIERGAAALFDDDAPVKAFVAALETR
jgi:CRISPR-associated protein Csy1